MEKEMKRVASYSRSCATNLENMTTEHPIAGKTKTVETKIRENPVLTENATV